LSERVREIQERRAREAAREMAEAELRRLEEPFDEESLPPLGLVPTPDAPPRNPIVTAALARIERARQPQAMPRARSSRSGAAAALAQFTEEDYRKDARLQTGTITQAAPEPAIHQTENVSQTKTAEPVREHTLVVVPALPPQPTPAPPTVAVQKTEPAKVEPTKTEQIKIETKAVEQTEPQRVIHKVLDDELLAKLEAQALPEPSAFAEAGDDRAPIRKRIAGGVIDLFVVAFASSPFAAIIELTNGNWSDMRVAASMGGIVLAVMFLYLTGAVALAGRTWGMSLVSLRAVDVNTGLAPTTKQAVGRAFTYMLSLAALGIGLLYALFDAEGRTAHDVFSGTAVVHE
jgi:uncharacterized RDD family membrane protein YckC